MPQLAGRLGVWDVPSVHAWKDRKKDFITSRNALVTRSAKIATIGSCFARELADSMGRLGLQGAMHPAGLFYSTRSIRQELEHLFEECRSYDLETHWKIDRGYVSPFRDYANVFDTVDELSKWRSKTDKVAEALFRSADVLVITLGLIEVWINPITGGCYRQIPHPDIFPRLGAQFKRLAVEEMKEDIVKLRELVKKHTNASLILTVSPVPLHATLTPLDVRVANTESKSRIRAAVSEIVEAHPDVHYFHSYEIVATAEQNSDFMLEDGRHVSRRGVDYILGQFINQYAADDVARPVIDGSWLTIPTKTAATPPPRHKRASALRGTLDALTKLIRR